MNDVMDAELLDQFKETGSDEAFAALVDRYINLVHSVALRHTTNSHQAEEITQAVFIILSRRAGSLSRATVLSGWLYHAARLTSANFIRSEIRRSKREHEAFMQFTLEETSPQPVWTEMSPLLDSAMALLRPADRDALVLRYFENRSLPEVGKALGVEERAAQKRVVRALEKLRRFLASQGVIATVGVIAAEMSSRSIQGAPLGLASKVTAAALKGSTVAGSTLTLVKGTLQIMTWLKAKTAIIFTSSTLLAVGASVAIAHYSRMLASDNRHRAFQEKLEAEHAGGSANLAADPDAQKLEAEQKELQQKALSQQQGRR